MPDSPTLNNGFRPAQPLAGIGCLPTKSAAERDHLFEKIAAVPTIARITPTPISTIGKKPLPLSLLDRYDRMNSSALSPNGAIILAALIRSLVHRCSNTKAVRASTHTMMLPNRDDLSKYPGATQNATAILDRCTASVYHADRGDDCTYVSVVQLDAVLGGGHRRTASQFLVVSAQLVVGSSQFPAISFDSALLTSHSSPRAPWLSAMIPRLF